MGARDIFAETPPPILYHYTTQSGLLGILKSKEIWATHTQYLNDQREFSHALGVIRDELIQAKARFPGNAVDRAFFTMMERTLRDSQRKAIENVCVCSFSEAGDILSQWRAYGGGASGFSIGFRGAFLRSISNHQGFWLVRCRYTEEEQRTLMRTLIDDVIAEVRGRTINAEEIGESLVTYLNRYAPILKHVSFQEEKEWRIISTPLDSTSPEFDFRPGRSMVTPYYRIPLCGPGTEFEIDQLVVGPTPHQTQARRAAHTLFRKHGLPTNIYSTSVPYRNW